MSKIYLKNLPSKVVVRRLKNGEAVYTDYDDSYYFKMIDGILCRVCNDGEIIYNAAMYTQATEAEQRYFKNPDDNTKKVSNLADLKKDISDLLLMVSNYYSPNVDIQGIKNKLINLQMKVNRL